MKNRLYPPYLRTPRLPALLGAILIFAARCVQAESQYNFVFTNGSVTITKYTGTAESVVVPKAFDGVPVTCIGPRAFYYDTTLRSIVVPGNVKVISHQAFLWCHALTNVVLQTGVESIESYAFNDTALTTLALPNSVTNLGPGIVAECLGLTNISAGDLNQSYVDLAGVLFDKELKTLVAYPAGRTNREYVIPGTIVSLEDCAFRDGVNLTNVVIPGSVTSIGKHAFAGCSQLASIVIPASVNHFGGCTFAACNSLKAVYFHGNAPYGDNLAFASCTNIGTVYHLRDASGWKKTFCHWPTAIWHAPSGGYGATTLRDAYYATIPVATNLSTASQASTTRVSAGTILRP